MFQYSTKTAWLLTHCIREAMKDESIRPQGGEGKVVEADKTSIGGMDGNRAVASALKKIIPLPKDARSSVA